MSDREVTTFVRVLDLDGFEVRAEGGNTLVGQAVPYGVDQRIDASLVERFAPGAFAHQIEAMHRVPLTYKHQSSGGEIIGRLVGATETDRGLQIEARVSDTSHGRDALTLVRDGAVGQLSIGFRCNSRGSRVEQGVTVRTRANLFEVAIVPEGAYGAGASVKGIRSLSEALRAAELDEDDDAETIERVSGALDAVAARALVDGIPLLSSRALR